MSNIGQSEQAVMSSMEESTNGSNIMQSMFDSILTPINEMAKGSSALLSADSQEMNSTTIASRPTSISSFWQETENMLIGSQEWIAAYQSLPEEKQNYLQVYGHLYDSISNPIDISGTNYDFASDSSGLEEMSLYLEKVSVEIEETIHSIYDEINLIQTNGDWEGEAFVTFKDKCFRYKEPLIDLVSLIKSFSSIFASLDEETVTLVKNIDVAINETSTYIDSTNTSNSVTANVETPAEEPSVNLNSSTVHQSTLGVGFVSGEEQLPTEATSTSDSSSPSTLDPLESVPWWNQEEVSTWCTDVNGVDFRLVRDEEWPQQFYKLYENGDKIPLTNPEDLGNLRNL